MNDFDKLINALPSIFSLMHECGVNTIDSWNEVLLTEEAMRVLLASGYFDGYPRETKTLDGCEFIYIRVGCITVKAVSVLGKKWE